MPTSLLMKLLVIVIKKKYNKDGFVLVVWPFFAVLRLPTPKIPVNSAE